MTNQDFEALSMIARIEFPLNHFCKHYSYQLYHYTSRKGLEGILASDKPSLWFSQYDYLNDPTELLQPCGWLETLTPSRWERNGQSFVYDWDI